MVIYGSWLNLIVVFAQYYNSNEHICCHVSFAQKLNVHHDNKPVNCNAIFCGCIKTGNFQVKILMNVVRTSTNYICFGADISKSSLPQ